VRRARAPLAEPFTLLEESALRVVCPGCGHAVPVDDEARCVTCGSALEAVLGAARGPPPPLPPRRLTRAQRSAILRPMRPTHYAWGTFFLHAGALMVPVALGFVWPLLLQAVLFMGMGALFRRASWPVDVRREQKRRLRALVWGLPAAAEITRVERQVVPTLEGGRRVQLDYAFAVHGQRIEGSLPSPHVLDLQRRPRERVWAVYVPEDPDINALWPPGP